MATWRTRRLQERDDDDDNGDNDNDNDDNDVAAWCDREGGGDVAMQRDGSWIWRLATLAEN